MQAPPHLNLPSDSELITDADEEVFILYSNLQQSSHSISSSGGEFRGLGFADSRTDVLTIQYELPPPKNDMPHGPIGRSSKRTKKHVKAPEPKTVTIQLAQDKTALRSRKGDTGSVVWKASIDFARLILEQLHGQVENPLFKPDLLKQAHVLELGAGTGLLSIALSPYVSHFTVTDIAELLPLIQKNVTMNFSSRSTHNQKSHTTLSYALRKSQSNNLDGNNITATELDWLTLRSTPAPLRHRIFPFNNSINSISSYDFRPIDILLIVDCIYHPSLIPALVESIDFLTVPNHTTTLVVAELRAEDTVREFLGLWLAVPGWKIWRVETLGPPYVIWCGCKMEP